MINARLFAINRKRFREDNFDITNGEEGGPLDRPLVVQFCANDPEYLLQSAKILQGHCDAIDINFGCPQDIARRGKYGSFLQDDWDLIYKLINTLHVNLDIPVTAKFRVFPTAEKTVEYAKMMERAGAQILTCHGRIREQRGHNCGLADWDKIRAVKEAVSVPVFANGNILHHSDIQRCLEATGADGVMSAEGQLYNAALFTPSPSSSSSRLSGLNPNHTDLALEYLSIVKSLKTRTSPGAIKAHMFKIMRPALEKHTDLRERLGKVMMSKEGIEAYEKVILDMKARLEAESASQPPPESDEDLARCYWLAQPYVRPPKPTAPPAQVEAPIARLEKVQETKLAEKTPDTSKSETEPMQLDPQNSPQRTIAGVVPLEKRGAGDEPREPGESPKRLKTTTTSIV